MQNKSAKVIYWIVWALLLTPIVYWQSLQYPFVTTKILYFQGLVELALPFYLYLLLKNPQYRPSLKNPLTISLLIYLGVILVSGMTGLNFDQSFWGSPARGSGVFNMAHYVLFYFYLLLVAKVSDNWISSITKGLIWVGVAAAVYAVLVRLGFPQFFPEPFWPRPSSFMGNPIFLASFLIILIFVSTLIALNEQKRVWRWLYIFCVFLMLAAVYVSKTRGAYLGLAGGLFVGTLVYFIFSKNKKIKTVGIIAMVLIGAGGIFLGMHYKFKDNDSLARLVQWKMAMQGFKDRPLLGVGPENYYILANKYYDYQLYNYDSEWWDKPHNTWIESLVTTGIVGLAAYLAVVVTVVWGLWKAFRSEILSLAEASLLLGAIVAYEVQNLFVFDTASAMLSYIFLLALLVQFMPEYARKTSAKFDSKKINPLVVTASLVILIIFYIGVIMPFRASVAVSKGLNLAGVDPQGAKASLDHAISLSTSTARLSDIGNFYEAAVVKSVNMDGIDKQFVLDEVDNGIALENMVNSKISNYPINWLKLANLYYIKAYLTGGGSETEQKSVEALNQVQALAPQRVEALFMLAKVEVAESKISDAESTMQTAFGRLPTNINSNWHILHKKEALNIYDLLIRHYASKESYKKVLDYYLIEIAIDPSNPQLYSGLATTYASLGNKAEAIKAANKLAELNPAEAQNVWHFIQSLK